MKKLEAFTTIPRIHVYIDIINDRLVFKIKDGYKLELQISETMKLFRGNNFCIKQYINSKIVCYNIT